MQLDDNPPGAPAPRQPGDTSLPPHDWWFMRNDVCGLSGDAVPQHILPAELQPLYAPGAQTHGGRLGARRWDKEKTIGQCAVRALSYLQRRMRGEGDFPAPSVDWDTSDECWADFRDPSALNCLEIKLAGQGSDPYYRFHLCRYTDPGSNVAKQLTIEAHRLVLWLLIGPPEETTEYDGYEADCASAKHSHAERVYAFVRELRDTACRARQLWARLRSQYLDATGRGEAVAVLQPMQAALVGAANTAQLAKAAWIQARNAKAQELAAPLAEGLRLSNHRERGLFYCLHSCHCVARLAPELEGQVPQARTPLTACINPWHLCWGVQRENKCRQIPWRASVHRNKKLRVAEDDAP